MQKKVETMQDKIDSVLAEYKDYIDESCKDSQQNDVDDQGKPNEQAQQNKVNLDSVNLFCGMNFANND